ncbi:hypothetical protein [uncultured Brevundimonas sp.]|uniref:hypothetical protein n=1 Tax=uncultured Brevundimonas sp. TaxID=213418 RepID=UPI0030EEE360|tara:strand:+ start:1521 stop:1919 length:399 start_codon:yes stop_codon:yes gene_type:complete
MNKNKPNLLATVSGLAGVMALGAIATNAVAQDRVNFRFADHSVGRTVSRTAPPLRITLEIRRTGLRISGADRSEICASFENQTRYDWSGGYRLTDREVRDTHASLRVPAYETVRRCETLNPQMVYYVVLRDD